jgi:branched-chain amino acid transport system ATP-binding protein
VTLAVDNLEVRYGGVHAVRGLSFSVAAGEIVGLIGPNGAGKSSTLHAIMGLTPASGSVQLDDAELLGRNPEDVARSGIALVPEGRRIFAELTVAENLRLGLAARSEPGGVRDLFERVCDQFRCCATFARVRPGCSQAASSSSSQSGARSSPSRTCSCSTSRHSGSRRVSSTSSSTR